MAALLYIAIKECDGNKYHFLILPELSTLTHSLPLILTITTNDLQSIISAQLEETWNNILNNSASWIDTGRITARQQCLDAESES